MKQAILWGVIFGIAAGIVEFLVPECIEPLIDMLAVFLAVLVLTHRLHPGSRQKGSGLGLVSGLSAGIVITLSDWIMAAFLGVGYFYKDQLPWIKFPDLSFLHDWLGFALLAILAIVLCMSTIKIIFILLTGVVSGWVLTSPGNKEA